MDKITLEQVKHQCRIDQDDYLDHELLEGYIDAAYNYAQNFTGRMLFEFVVPDDVENGMIITPSVNHACLMLVSYWYSSREAVSDVKTAELPLGVHHLLQPYRIMGV
ncbi:hypothetical protein MOVS_01335 [Moraxella ovis]|uniref:Uncharacterized phage protein (Possible DNA packaging) n=1 Tax=Moraxella ovis TaxID=29433 RepID=A0A378PHP0_9GAMM|nr:head-tail connector protein [Moraxella ovis]ANB90859.1 hypothetical protein MOVS_01335 [Moraxella ovis]STY86301.1 uncharacterized phage protein (possible DNA packaging) [Moraxella ovis]